MRAAVIRKSPSALRPTPNLADYEAERRRFSWEGVRAELGTLPGGGLNIAYAAVDRHLGTKVAHRTAFRFVGRGSSPREVSYAALARLTNRFANVLRGLGVGKGDHLFVLAGRVPELYVAVLGALKNGTVVTPLFSAFGPEPIRTRLSIGAGKVLVTTEALYRRKVAGIVGDLPQLRDVLLIGENGARTDVPGTRDLATLMDRASDAFEVERTSPDDMALLHFTSGTTGTPKGAVHVHGAVVTHYATGRYALDLHPDDLFWYTTNPN